MWGASGYENGIIRTARGIFEATPGAAPGGRSTEAGRLCGDTPTSRLEGLPVPLFRPAKVSRRFLYQRVHSTCGFSRLSNRIVVLFRIQLLQKRNVVNLQMMVEMEVHRTAAFQWSAFAFPKGLKKSPYRVTGSSSKTMCFQMSQKPGANAPSWINITRL